MQYAKLTLIFLLFTAFFFTACKNEKSSDSSETANAETPEEAPIHVKSERAAVAIGFWHYKTIAGSDEEKERYKGRWIHVKRDDTFISGLYDQQTNSGTWTFDDPSSTILFKYKDSGESLAYEWKVQGFGTTTIWMGNTPSNPKATQIKMEKVDEGTYPEKK